MLLCREERQVTVDDVPGLGAVVKPRGREDVLTGCGAVRAMDLLEVATMEVGELVCSAMMA